MTCETAQNAFQLRNSRLLSSGILAITVPSFGPHVEELCEAFGCSVHVAQCFMCQTAHRKSIKACDANNAETYRQQWHGPDALELKSLIMTMMAGRARNTKRPRIRGRPQILFCLTFQAAVPVIIKEI